jgi:hypothetical protein
VDNENSTDDADGFKVDINSFGLGDDTSPVTGMVISGYNTLDGTYDVGNGGPPHTRALASQETGWNWEDAGIGNMTSRGVRESDDTVCIPGAAPGTWTGVPATSCFNIISGNPAATQGSLTDGLTETGLTQLYDMLREQAVEDNPALVLTGAADNSAFPATIGATGAGNGKIAVIENGSGQIDFNNNLEGWGILLVKGRVRIDTNSVRWHGIVMLTCRGSIEMNDSATDTFEVWGGLYMINNEDGGSCGGGSAEERFELNVGRLHIYYSAEAIQNYAEPFLDALKVIAWREIDT